MFNISGNSVAFLKPRLFLDINTTWVISATATATAIGAVRGEEGPPYCALICAISLTFCHLGSLQLVQLAKLISSQPQNNQRANEARKLSLTRSCSGSCSVAAIELRHPGPVHISHYTVAQPAPFPAPTPLPPPPLLATVRQTVNCKVKKLNSCCTCHPPPPAPCCPVLLCSFARGWPHPPTAVLWQGNGGGGG